MTYPNYSKTLALLFASVALVLGACGTKSESADGACSPGGELCACTSNGGCDDGLICATNLNQCVRLASDTGGSTGSGGATGSGGSTASGGSTGSGGTVASGGTSGAGGRGGTTGSGGAAGSGVAGASGRGGTTGSGGAAGSGVAGASGRGGATGSGGTASGGTTGTGGAKGGTTGSGGTTGTGGTTGSGGATSTTCGTLSPSASGNGEFTHYNFGQGTSKGELGDYQTACGYLGTEGGNSIDTVMNIANTSPAKNTYFAAIPGNSSSDFNTSGNCGACVQISNSGKTIIATIIDECPESSNTICKQNPNGELDLSVDAFNQLGFPNGNPSGTSWKVVPCPVTGNVVVRIKQANEVYIENVILALKTVSGPGGGASHTSYGSWHFNSNVGSGSQLTLTDVANRTIMVTLGSGATDQNQDTGKQFPTCQ